MIRRRFGQPEWAFIEEKALGDEWASSDSDLTIIEYINQHASERLKAEYKRQKEVHKKLSLGKVILPDGEIIMSD